MLYSGNQLTDLGANSLARIMTSNNKIKSFLLHWNKIRNKGGVEIAKALEKNTTIETFDISFNNIGGGFNENECANEFKEAFKENKSLIHVDISFCGFNVNEILILNEGLTDNHTIWGIHCLGNAGKTNQLGFLVPMTIKDDPIIYSFARINGKLLLCLLK